MHTAAESRVVPNAFRRAEAVRGVGLGLVAALSALSGVLLAVLLVAMYVATGLVGEGPARFLPGLALAVGFAAYLAVAPSVFAHLTRATTARDTGGWIVAAVAGHAVGWAAVTLAVGGA